MGSRPDPDRARGTDRRRGKLTIFFGSAPGVGKTYAMLEAARFEREEGRDVVLGIVETHGRYDTGALLLGLEILPRREGELDLDAALARRPGLILVDELAHPNAAGSRHAKRWQDIDELLDAGLDVYTTLNVQHIESLNDVVAQITHVVVRETVPDSVFEAAEDVRLVDLPIDELLERIDDGKVFASEHPIRARENFFREGNLIALRELALRLTAERVDAQMRAYREKHGIERTWAVAERILVCVSPSPASDRLVRAARRLATSLHADLIAAYVESAGAIDLSTEDRKRVTDHLRLAQVLGAETITLSGANAAEEVTRFARSRNVTRIVVGKPTHPSWRDWLRASFLDRLVRQSGDIEVHVLSGEATKQRPSPDARPSPSPRRLEPLGALGAIVTIAITTMMGHLFFETTQLADIVMLYLFGIVLVSLRWGLLPSLLAAILSVCALDFFFIPPFHTLLVSDMSHVTTFAVMFIIAAVTSGLTKRVRDQGEAARQREIRTASLYSLSGALSRAKTTSDVANAGTKHVHDVFGVRAIILVPGESGQLANAGETSTWSLAPDDAELAVATWTWNNGRAAGAGSETLPSSRGSYIPLEASGARVGVLGTEGASATHPDARQHLAAFAGQIAVALERTRLAEKAHEAQLRIEAEQLRNSLLSSVSHDLRTPLAVITGAASTLLDDKIDAATRKDLTETVLTEAEHLTGLVRNLLDMTRLEAGAVKVKKEWQSIEEAVGAALERADRTLGDHTIATHLPSDLPLVPYDSILLQQVLVNLFENAAKYTPAGTTIDVSARALDDDEIEIVVADRGPGLAPGDESKIFTKFYRAGKGGGAGLGLTICQGIVTAHGGRIWAENREGGGATFHFTLPLEGKPPSLEIPESHRAEAFP